MADLLETSSVRVCPMVLLERRFLSIRVRGHEFTTTRSFDLESHDHFLRQPPLQHDIAVRQWVNRTWSRLIGLSHDVTEANGRCNPGAINGSPSGTIPVGSERMQATNCTNGAIPAAKQKIRKLVCETRLWRLHRPEKSGTDGVHDSRYPHEDLASGEVRSKKVRTTAWCPKSKPSFQLRLTSPPRRSVSI